MNNDDPNAQNGVTQDDQTPVTNPTPMGGDTPVSPSPMGEEHQEETPGDVPSEAPAETPTPGMGEGEPSAPVETPAENPA